jgi:hypothetical protein
MKLNVATTTVLLGLALAASALARDINPADYPLTAKVLSSEKNGTGLSSEVMNVSTGGTTGTTTCGSFELEELQIGNTIYLASLWGRGGIDGKVGDSFPARIGRHGRFTVIYVLGMCKNGKPRSVRLKVIGQRVEK